MRIITWNCNMAFRKKVDYILPLNPDILIVPECEHPDKLKFSTETTKPSDTLWFGSNRNKGLGIFSYGDIKLKLLDTHNPELRMIVPILVESKRYQFTLYAIWANNPNDPDGTYIEQIWKAIHYYERYLINKTTMLIGDFNSNTIWDKQHRESNHSNVVKFLEEKEIYSSYHLYHQQVQGKEKHPTLYMYRHKDKH
jgi:exodeoxyribonuclease-3